MKGLDSFEISRTMTLQELEAFMEANWNKLEYGEFEVGHPTAPNATPQYVMLPATDHWCVIIYPKSGGIFKKGNYIKGACTLTSSGAGKMLQYGSRMYRRDAIAQIKQTKNDRELTKEMQTIGDEILRQYMDYLKFLMQGAGLTV